MTNRGYMSEAFRSWASVLRFAFYLVLVARAVIFMWRGVYIPAALFGLWAEVLRRNYVGPYES